MNLGVAVSQALSQMVFMVRENPMAMAWPVSLDEFLGRSFWGGRTVVQRVSGSVFPLSGLWSLNKLGRHPGQKWPRVACGTCALWQCPRVATTQPAGSTQGLGCGRVRLQSQDKPRAQMMSHVSDVLYHSLLSPSANGGENSEWEDKVVRKKL